jgi:PAS domain S-box-containing protein
MATEKLGRGLAALSERLSCLESDVNRTSDSRTDLMLAALEEWRSSLEELRSAEEELHQQNEELLATREAVELQRRRYQELFEFAPEAYLVTDLAGNIEQSNSAASELLETRPQSLAQKPLSVFVVPEERHACRVELLQLSQYQFKRELSLRLVTASGRPFDADLTVAVFRDAAGKPVSLRWLIRDITASQRAEALRASEARFRGLFESEMVGILFWHVDGRVVDANDAFLQLIGYSRADVQGGGLRWTDLTPPSFAALDQRMIEQLRARGRCAPYQKEYIRKDGKRIPILMGGSFLPGREDLGVGFVVDITERKRMEEALRSSERRFRQLANAVPSFVWTTDLEGAVNYINERFCSYTGMTAAGSVGFGWVEAVHPDDRRRCLDSWQQAVQAGEPYAIELRYRSAHREYRWTLVRAEPLRDANGAMTGWCGIGTDIEEKKQFEQQLQEASRRKDEFLAMLAHELRNPLAAISNATHVLNQISSSGDQSANLRNIIGRQTKLLTRMVDDLLDVSRITRGTVQLRKETVDLTALVHRAVEAVRSQVEKQRLHLEVQGLGGPIWLEADPARIEQMITNLLSNAVKYTGAGGKISVSVQREGDQAVVNVRDSGIGIAPDLLPRVFDLFRQADRTLDRTQGGLGIGLTLVRRLAELHGGTVSAFSAGPGQGSEFVIRLPTQTHSTPPAQGISPPPERPRQLLHILVVEDNPDAAQSLAMMLRLWGHEVRVARDGPAGLAALQKERPEVVFLDIGLPGMDGYEVARRIREQPGMSQLLIIAVTGYGREQDQRRSHEAGFDAHMVKPVTPEAFQQVLARMAPQD